MTARLTDNTSGRGDRVLPQGEPITVTLVPDQVLPFRIDKQDVRGRVIRLGPSLDKSLAAHNYPPLVADTLVEAITLAGLLGSMIKGDGLLTLQVRAKGAIEMLVADYRYPGMIRGYAQFDRDRIAALSALGTPRPQLSDLLGDGYLAMTIEQGYESERYQGIVELEGPDIATATRNYFLKSEQTPTEIALAHERDDEGKHRSGAIIIQHLGRGEDGGPRILDPDQREHWDRASALMNSVREQELTSETLSNPELLYRLFHEDGVRVFEPLDLAHGCRCSHEKIAGVLRQFSAEDLSEMVEDGAITVTCEFCSTAFRFGGDGKPLIG
ncbi:MAG: Hsp33 family molecular chaperone HslO [Pseudomonadota bacterium]